MVKLEKFNKWAVWNLRDSSADTRSEFKLEEVNGDTRLTWRFDLATPRPKNIFNLFYNMDKKMGRDFEEGLLLIINYFAPITGGLRCHIF